MDARRQQAEELRRHIEWTLARTVDPSNLLPMLHRLARLADDGSEDAVFANLHLAELLVERDPWRAALHARRVVAQRVEDDRGWATLALCQTFLGHFKFAVSAYHRALASSPNNPWYAHNLGHLLDVALDRAPESIGWLKRAYESAPASAEVAASYAHALARDGKLAEARRVLTRATKRTPSREHAALLRWLEQGAPPEKDHPLPRPAPVRAITMRDAADLETRSPQPNALRVSRSRSKPREGAREQARYVGGDGRSEPEDDAARGGPSFRQPLQTELDAVLTRGLVRLPLDARQRTRAKALARDVLTYFSGPVGGRTGVSAPRSAVHAVAAAVAYAIVYVDHIPLTQADVAACFRVRVASLRGRFGELRTRLDLTPGDARYATVRRR
ncbi:MAG: tetratricopeptide repeat protein [Myxococcota bacterium]|nr:tetratricopeptide repeat protein [Myxococcota bacterium]